MSIYIKNVLHNGTRKDIYIEENTIEQMGTVDEERKRTADVTLDGSDKLAAPALHNSHTHAAMTLFRGYGDDLPLQKWLEEKIWPAEQNLTEEDVYWGTRLACLEMIKTGTTFFNDMYWQFDGTCKAVEDSGIRAAVSAVFIDHFDEEKAKDQREETRKNLDRFQGTYSDRLQFAVGPHAIYTVSEDSLRWASEFSREHDVPFHIHLSETKQEVEECKENHGTTPAKYLDRLEVLHENTVVAHGVWLTDEEIKLLGERGASVVHNPLPNYKLASGMNFKFERMKQNNVPVYLGTDGPASNNNLNLFEEIKMTALVQKCLQEDPSKLPADEVLKLATEAPAAFFGVNSGCLEEGKLADLLLLDTMEPCMAPLHDEQSLLAYSASGGCVVDTTICNGEILMENRSVQEEERIIEEASTHAHALLDRE